VNYFHRYTSAIDQNNSYQRQTVDMIQCFLDIGWVWICWTEGCSRSSRPRRTGRSAGNKWRTWKTGLYNWHIGCIYENAL